MPFGTFINLLPPEAFLLWHATAFLAGAFFAYRFIEHGAKILGWGFSLYALAAIVYMTSHLGWTVFLFAHTVAEALDLAGFVLVFSAAARSVAGSTRAWAERTP